MENMRDWIKILEEAGELIRIKKEVDGKKEMGALIWQAVDKALLFEKIAGYPGWRALAQAPANMRHIGLSFNLKGERAIDEYNQRLAPGPRECKLVDTGPVKEVVWKGKEVDLRKIPVSYLWEGDGGPYIGTGLDIVRDPESGIRNMAFHRHMVKEKDRMGVQMRSETHQWKIYQKYEERNQAMPIAIAIGHHPLVHYPAAWSGAMEIDELELASRLQGSPLELVKCETVDLEVPAQAEIVIEGEVPPKVRKKEGPFGEFQGYSGAGAGMNPVVRVKAITLRKDPIYKNLLTFRQEGSLYVQFNMAARSLARLREIGGGLQIYTVYVTGDLMTIILQMTQQFRGEAKNALLGALAGPYLHPKIAIAVDEDVDIYDPLEVMWAVSTRVNPEKDVFIIPQTRGHSYDLSLEEIGRPGDPRWQAVGSKMGIDATKPSLKNDLEQRARFERIRPKGWGEVFLKDFIS